MSKLWPKYENWSKQENQNRLYRYKSNMYRYKLVKNDQNRSCTGTSSNCTGTSHSGMPRMCVFSHFSCIFIHGSLLYFLHTSKSFQNHLGISFLFNSSFNFISFFKNPSWISSKTLLVWVITHTQTKHED